MDFVGVLKACLSVGVVGLIIGVLLGIASKIFAVKTDEKEEKIRELLPGNNCGGCGFAGCDGLAAAIAKGEAAVNGCPVGGEAVAAAIGEIMGTSAESNKMVAFVKCNGDCDSASVKYEYTGNISCREAVYVTGGGPKSCSYGCMGFGSCVEECQFDAIHVVNGIAVVDREKCVACGKCVAACPKNLIELIPYKSSYVIPCNSNDKGADVKKSCKTGCIGCTLCTKDCPTDAVKVTNFLAHINQDLCCGCGLCAQKCPQKIIKEVSP